MTMCRKNTDTCEIPYIFELRQQKSWDNKLHE